MSHENKTFVNKTIKSNYLNADLEVSCWEMQSNGRTLTIIEHAAFEDIIFNKLHTYQHIEGFNYELDPLVGVASHPVFKCVMTDHSTSRKIIAIGESHPDSLVNWISKQNSVIMASNRAFDRAAIRYLDLEGKVYSSEEIPADEDTEEPSSSEGDCNGDVTFLEAQVDDTQTAHPIQTGPLDQTQNPGSVVVNFGTYRGKNLTVAEIYETDLAWAKKAVDLQLDSAGESTKMQLKAIKDYVKIQENKQGE